MGEDMQKALDDAKADMAARTAREKEIAASIGTHLATLGLFRESDGSVKITVAGATGALAEYNALNSHLQSMYERPIDYVEMLIGVAAEDIQERTKR